MILVNENNFELTLKAFEKDSLKNNLIVNESGSTTLSLEEKVLYLCLDNKMNKKSLEKTFSSIVSSSKYDMNIDLDSVLNIFENKKEVFQLVVEIILFSLHQQFSMKEKNSEFKSFSLLFDNKYNDIYETSKIKVEYVNFARDLQDLPPNIGTSIEIANRIEEKAKKIDGLKVTILNKKQIEDNKMGLLLGVNEGSHIDARVVILEYCTDDKLPKTAYVGKGITFDTGGYNLKGSQFLANMKFDMSGCAIVSAAVLALAKKKAKCNVVSIGLLTDNRIGGHATLTESVLTSMNGKTVEIGNTDAEGRLVLADGMTYAIRKLKADRLITVATLTGAIRVALGPWYTGAFSNNNEFYNEFENGSKKSFETIWRLPMDSEHLKVMQGSKIADLDNSGTTGFAGSSTAAAFLNAFSEDKPYIHLDVASTAYEDKRGKATMARTLFEMLNK
ncbi:M17 family metallopeptidase [Spiroplasma tabanidicola]|uniref:Probable cytosol aminopeptidase n=1 Tax=Spiroplasma tabanidicola TaxID=324079 RepID=A0A6I6CDK5_9MOLU|nr:M17 family metallopeptidase [Spiroplasma tabanidicola]QGS52388.1 leucyl aminopeptidase family protein [Spiroplasma tabanidicola]